MRGEMHHAGAGEAAACDSAFTLLTVARLPR